MGQGFAPSRMRCVALLLSGLLLVVGCMEPTPTPQERPTLAPTSTNTSPAPTSSPTHPIVTATATQDVQSEPTLTPTPSFTAILRIGFQGALEPLRPLATAPTIMGGILPLLYDRLVYPALDNTYQPSLAQTWSTEDGGQTWVLELHPDVRFSDGHPLDAEDVVFTLELFRSHPNHFHYAGHDAPIAGVEATGSHTVTLALNQAVGNVEALLYWMPILPKHLWESRGISETTTLEPSTATGSGPFILADIQDGRVALASNREYWMGAPKIDAVVFESYADASTLAQALMEGAVDLWQDVPQEQLSELKAAYDVQVVTGPGMGLRCVLLNVSDDSTSTGHPALRDPTVRLALAHAIDRQQTIDLTLGGAGMPGLGVIPPALRTWFNPNLQNVPFELQTARSILDAAACTDTDSDGIREMPGSGTDLAFRLFIPSDSQTAARQAELLGNWMRQIGISVSTLTMDRAALEAAGCPTCDFDLLLVDREATHDPSPLLSAFSTGAPASNRNASGHSNAVYGALYDQQLSTLDVEQRRQIIWQMQEVLLEDRPCIALYYEVAVQAFRRDRFHNWLYALNGTLSLADKRSLLRVEAVR